MHHSEIIDENSCVIYFNLRYLVIYINLAFVKHKIFLTVSFSPPANREKFKAIYDIYKYAPLWNYLSWGFFIYEKRQKAYRSLISLRKKNHCKRLALPKNYFSLNNWIYCAISMVSMVFTSDRNSEHVARAWRKMIFAEKKSDLTNKSKYLHNSICAHRFLSYHLI